MSKYFYVRYVQHQNIPSYEKLGWKVEDAKDPCHHCYYAKTMKYYGDLDPPPEPKIKK